MKNIDFQITRTVYAKVHYWMRKAPNYEISGYGTVEMIQGIPTVTEVYLPPQIGNAAETEIDPEHIGQLQAKVYPKQLRWWWHSHHDMSAHWSGQDYDNMEEQTENGWFLCSVFNLKGASRHAVIVKKPIPLLLDDANVRIVRMWTAAEQHALDKAFEENVKRGTPKSSKEEMDLLWGYGYGSGLPLYLTKKSKPRKKKGAK